MRRKSYLLLLAFINICALPLIAQSADVPAVVPVKPFSWQPQSIERADGSGGSTSLPGQVLQLDPQEGPYFMPFGIAQRENGEILLLLSWRNSVTEVPVIIRSTDGGNTWGEATIIPNITGRPMVLAYLGDGKLTFVTNKRYFSSDFGLTWDEGITRQPSTDGGAFEVEGNPLIEYDPQGIATRIAEVGWHYQPGKAHPISDATASIRWSTDGAKTWQDERFPPEWKYTVEYQGKSYVRGVSEGSLARAKNGWLVAVLRTDLSPRFFAEPNDDSLEGTGVSISKDDGKTWTPLKILYDAGRHHAALLRLSNGDLLMTFVVKDDVELEAQRKASNRQGCEAIVSHDNGLTWDLKHRFVLDAFDFNNDQKWYESQCGHLASCLLRDGTVLTAYGNYYVLKGAVLIRWKPKES